MQRPDIIIVGVGHSGTTITTRMLQALGWNIPEGDDIAKGWAEPSAMLKVNGRLMGGAFVKQSEFLSAWESVPAPRVMKDPRLVLTLSHWIKFFVNHQPPPLLLSVHRSFADLSKSYARRGWRLNTGELGLYGRPLTKLQRQAAGCYTQWPWQKLRVSLEQLADAVKLFDAERPFDIARE